MLHEFVGTRSNFSTLTTQVQVNTNNRTPRSSLGKRAHAEIEAGTHPHLDSTLPLFSRPLSSVDDTATTEFATTAVNKQVQDIDFPAGKIDASMRTAFLVQEGPGYLLTGDFRDSVGIEGVFANVEADFAKFFGNIDAEFGFSAHAQPGSTGDYAHSDLATEDVNTDNSSAVHALLSRWLCNGTSAVLLGTQD